MPLLLCDLDDTLVDRGAAFARWAAAFAARHDQDQAFVDWLSEIDGAGFGPRPEFFVHIHERLGLAQTVDQFVADYYDEFLPQFRSDDAVCAALGRRYVLVDSSADAIDVAKARLDRPGSRLPVRGDRA